MDKSKDEEQLELSKHENADLSPQSTQPYLYSPAPPMGYPVQPNPAYNPNQQLAPVYISPPIQVQNSPQTIAIQYGRHPITMVCPACNQTTSTITKKRPGLLIFILVLFFILGFWPAFFVPFLFCCWYDVYHSCDKCRTTIGVRNMIRCQCCQWYKIYRRNL